MKVSLKVIIEVSNIFVLLSLYVFNFQMCNHVIYE